MNETILIIFIFFMILLFSLLFVSKIQNVSLQRKKISMQNLEIIEVSKLLKGIPELSCSLDNVLSDNCYDVYKVEAFSELANAKKNYFMNTPLANTNITLYQYDPFHNQEVRSWQIYYSPLNDSDIRKVWFPISIYDPVTRTNSFGIVELWYYKK